MYSYIQKYGICLTSPLISTPTPCPTTTHTPLQEYVSHWIWKRHGSQLTGLQVVVEERAEESDKAAVRKERFVGSTF